MDQSLILLGLKKIFGWSQFFLRVDKYKNFKLLYIIFFFQVRSCNHLGLNMAPPLARNLGCQGFDDQITEKQGMSIN